MALDGQRFLTRGLFPGPRAESIVDAMEDVLAPHGVEGGVAPVKKRERGKSGLIRGLATVSVALGLVAVTTPSFGNVAGAAAVTTTPTCYVRQVCLALNNWSDKTSGDDSGVLKALSANKRSPKSARQAIAALYAAQMMATDKLIAATKAIGTPRLSNGQQVATDYLQTLGDTRAAYSTAHSAVLHAPIVNKTVFATAMTPIDTALATAYTSIGDPLTTLNADQTLATAIQADSGCATVTSSYNTAPTSGLKVGDCTGSVETKVDCSKPHNEEVTLVTAYPASSTAPYPGNDALNAFTDQTCSAALTTYLGVTIDQSKYSYGWYSPDAGADWNGGDREIVCTVDNQDNSLIVGSVKGQAS